MRVRDLLVSARSAFWLRDCHRVGEHPRLHGRPTAVASGGRILIGNRFRLASRPVPSHLVTGPLGLLEIGHDVSIAHGAAVVAFENVLIGEGTCIGPFALIMDTNFHGGSGDQSIQHDCRPVVIGSHCRIGSRVTITRGASIGDGAEILAGSVVSSAIPPGVCAGGARARIVGRAGDTASRWDGVAATLSELVMQVFGLEAPPDLETPSSDILGWNAGGMTRLCTEIENRFGASIEAPALSRAVTLADAAAIVERARAARSGREVG
jgi:acetyltransferase-like isoleucine patch superfamily enzyme/acyl carrier protein